MPTLPICSRPLPQSTKRAHERAARLMELGFGQTWHRGEVVTLLGWLRKLPEETMRRPLLKIWYAASLMLVGRSEGVEYLLEEAEDGASSARAGDRRGRQVPARPSPGGRRG